MPQDCFYGLFCCSVIAAKPGCIQRLVQEQGEGVSGERVLHLFNQLFNCAFLHLPVCIYRKRNKAIRANYKKNGLQSHRPGGGITEIFILFESLGRRERALALNPLVRQEE